MNRRCIWRWTYIAPQRGGRNGGCLRNARTSERELPHPLSCRRPTKPLVRIRREFLTVYCSFIFFTVESVHQLHRTPLSLSLSLSYSLYRSQQERNLTSVYEAKRLIHRGFYKCVTQLTEVLNAVEGRQNKREGQRTRDR